MGGNFRVEYEQAIQAAFGRHTEGSYPFSFDTLRSVADIVQDIYRL
jgi:hypothetical protein